MDNLLQKLTIAIPVFNDASYIEQTIMSCLPHAGRIVIYDNCSTDGTSGICEKLSREHDHVHYMRHPENIGAFANFKCGLDDCKTEYFCWVGSHDVLGENYSRPLLEAAEMDSEIALAAGKIVLINETGTAIGKAIESHWANRTKDKSPLERAGACAIGMRRDCLIFYAIYRTIFLRQTWFDQACLGFDRAVVVRTAAAGKIIYVPDVIFHARNLDHSRDSKTDRDRRVKTVGRQAIAKDVFLRNKMMVSTIWDNAHSYEDLNRAFYFTQKINRRYQNRRYYQKRRLFLISLSLLLIICFILALRY